jgi:hypothetical protein
MSDAYGAVTNNSGSWIRWLDLLALLNNYSHLISSHIELLLNDACLTNRYEESRTGLWISRIRLFNSIITLRPTVSRPVCLGIKHPSGAYDQILIAVWQFRICWCGALSFTIAAGPRQRSHFRIWARETRDHILLSQIRVSYDSQCCWAAGIEVTSPNS